MQFSGLATSSMLDKIVEVNDFSITTNDITGTTATLSQADELVLTSMCTLANGPFDGDNTNVGIAAPATFTSLFTEQNNSTSNPAGGAYKIVAATTAVTAAWSHNQDSGGEAGEAIATYKQAGAARTTKNTRSNPLGMELGMNLWGGI